MTPYALASPSTTTTVATAEQPLPNLADLLSAALRAGLQPHKIRQIIRTHDRTPLPASDL